MKTIVTIVLLSSVLLLTQRSAAQITISSDDFLTGFNASNNGATFDSGDTTISKGLLATNGVNCTWDFTKMAFTPSISSSTTTMIDYPGGAALANDPAFTSANKVMKDVPTDPTQAITYTFYTINSTGWYMLGITQDSVGTKTKIASYSPALQQYKFPLTYQTVWKSTSSVTQSIFPIPAGVDVGAVVNSVVDSYGALLLPGGGSQPSIRVRSSMAITFSVFGLQVAPPLITYSFDWLTKTGYSAAIATDSAGKPINVSYTAPKGSGSVASLFPMMDDPMTVRLSNNPVSNGETQLYYTMKADGNAQVSMMDALGHDVRMLQNGRVSAGQNIIPIDASALTPGTYFLHIAAEGTTVTRKLVVTR